MNTPSDFPTGKQNIKSNYENKIRDEYQIDTE